MTTIPVSNGELVDKITILKIKINKIKIQSKLNNVLTEYNMLRQYLNDINFTEDHKLFKELYNINLEFWEYHDWQRERWIKLQNDNYIDIELFKKNKEEHLLNDKRARVKKEINNLTNSVIIEEKQFISYNI